MVATLLALVTRSASLIRNRRLKPKSTLQSAIGVRHSHIEQKAQGAMGGSFNTREFFHGRSAGALRAVKHAFLLLVFVLPVLLLGAAYLLESSQLPMIAFALQYLGLLAERFYFFADARHPQNLYYRYIS